MIKLCAGTYAPTALRSSQRRIINLSAIIPVSLLHVQHFSSEHRRQEVPVHKNHPIRRAVNEALQKNPFPPVSSFEKEEDEIEAMKNHIKQAVKTHMAEGAMSQEEPIQPNESHIYLNRGKKKDKYMPISPWIEEPRVYVKKIDELGRSYGKFAIFHISSSSV